MKNPLKSSDNTKLGLTPNKPLSKRLESRKLNWTLPFRPWSPFGMEDVFAEGVEKVDFGRLRQQKKEVNLAMHRQEVPLVNVFLEGVKSDPEALARTPASSFIDRAQKTILTSAYAFGEIYVSMAKADKEIQRLKRRDELAKSKMAEAQEAIREKNALLVQKEALAKEVEELKRSKAEEVAAARVEASSPSEPQRS
ncbi:Pentatricopeptide repeat superfamily protein [Prunus dulcis]|uniref:Pentatricopeptide repeat superfamily protein n=1 Tax=Prunus dulcis TaxID=3755 RepID=A0A5H2XLT0_PRUDU|nr:Pentatricopeptide repeat superfamily protein [Prunus dulcis]